MTVGGVVGTLPVSDRSPVSFLDDKAPTDLVGTVTLLGRAAEPRDVQDAR